MEEILESTQFLIPDYIKKISINNLDRTINIKIIPDGTTATKYISSYVQRGDLIKPESLLNDGTGIPKGITVHNTYSISCAKETNPAEQYTRATYPNQNMNGAVVHYWVWHDDIWQQLSDREQGYHAADGTSRRKDHKGEMTGGNRDTISIECIGEDEESEYSTAILCAYLCKEYNLNPLTDIYTHNYWMYGLDEMKTGATKNCPLYILPHWDKFIDDVANIYDTDKQLVNNPDKWAETAVFKAIDRGILIGDENGNLRLRESCTRQEMVAFLHRAYNYLKERI